MICDHSLFRCTNGVFFCLKCGQEIQNPYKVATEAKKPQEPAPKRGKKTKAD